LEKDVYTKDLGESINNAEEISGEPDGEPYEEPGEEPEQCGEACGACSYGGANGCAGCNDAGSGGCAEACGSCASGRPSQDGVLDLVYGVFFEPARTFAGLANQPPLRPTVIIVLFLSLATVLTVFFDLSQYTAEMAVSAPVFVVGMMVLILIKWFFMAGLLHLIASFYGGWGDVRSVFAICGLAGLPAVLIIPLELLTILLAPGTILSTITFVLTLLVVVWSVALLIIGIREVHGFSGEKAALTVFTPLLAFIGILLVGLIMFGAAIPSLNL